MRNSNCCLFVALTMLVVSISSADGETITFDFENFTEFKGEADQTVGAWTLGETAIGTSDKLNGDKKAENGFVFTGPPTAGAVSTLYFTDANGVAQSFTLDSFDFSTALANDDAPTVRGMLGETEVWSFTPTNTKSEFQTSKVSGEMTIDSITITNPEKVNNGNRFDNFVITPAEAAD